MLSRSVLAIVFASFFVGSAAADESEACGCVTTRAASESGIGNIISSTGDVFMSSKSGFNAVAPGQKISEDAEIIVGCQAVAQIKVGQTCDLLLSAGSEVQIVASGANLCVRSAETVRNCGGTTKTGSVNGSGTLSSAKSQTNGGPAIGLPEVLFGLTATTWVVTGAAVGDPKPASP